MGRATRLRALFSARRREIGLIKMGYDKSRPREPATRWRSLRACFAAPNILYMLSSSTLRWSRSLI